MYAQSHAVGLHWTQEYDREEGLYTKINLCTSIGPIERYTDFPTVVNEKLSVF